MAENFELPFFEVSCKNNINIEEAFITLARRIRELRENKVSFYIKITTTDALFTMNNFCMYAGRSFSGATARRCQIAKGETGQPTSRLLLVLNYNTAGDLKKKKNNL